MDQSGTTFHANETTDTSGIDRVNLIPWNKLQSFFATRPA